MENSSVDTSMLEQGSIEWFRARLGRATASRFGDVLAMDKAGKARASRKNYKSELMLERIWGEAAESFSNAYMQWGLDMEPIALQQYWIRTGRIPKPTGFFQHPTLKAGASPDGLVDEDGLVEAKNRTTANHIEVLKLGRMPDQYMPQVQGQLWITGRQWCDWISFDIRMPVNAQLFIQRILRNEDYISTLAVEIESFLNEVSDEVRFVRHYKEPVYS